MIPPLVLNIKTSRNQSLYEGIIDPFDSEFGMIIEIRIITFKPLGNRKLKSELQPILDYFFPPKSLEYKTLELERLGIT